MFNYKQLRAPSLTNFDFWVPISYVLWKVWTKMNIRGLWHAMFNSLVKITLAASVQQNISLIKIIKLQVTWLLNNFRLWLLTENSTKGWFKGIIKRCWTLCLILWLFIFIDLCLYTFTPTVSLWQVCHKKVYLLFIPLAW